MRRSILSTRHLRDSSPGGDPTPGVGGGASADQAPAVVTPTVVPPAAKQATGQQEHKPGDGLPDDADALKAEILRLRGENASARTNAKAKAAEDAKKELAQQIGKALGIVEDEIDPAKLTEQLTAAKTAQAEAARELAIFKAAPAAGADPARLLDSRSFLAAIGGVDPADGEKLTAAITAAVQANPALGAAPTAGASTVDHAGGSGEKPPQKTLAEALQKVYG